MSYYCCDAHQINAEEYTDVPLPHWKCAVCGAQATHHYPGRWVVTPHDEADKDAAAVLEALINHLSSG